MGLFVALYLILLAFFLILTSVSSQSTTRASAVMDSVNETFETDGTANRVAIDPRAQAIAADDPVLRSIQRSFFSELEVEGRFSNAGGGSFEVTFSEEYLFQPGSFRVRADMGPFLSQLLEALKESNQEQAYEIAFMFGTGGGAVAREPTRPQEIAIRRAGSLARFFQEQGLRPGYFTTGFTGIAEGEVLVVFNRRLPRGQRSLLGVS